MTTPDNPYQSPTADVVTERALGGAHNLMPARRVPARRGAAWIGEAFTATVAGTPGWILFALVFALIYLPILAAAVVMESAGPYAAAVLWFFYYPLASIWWGGALSGCHPGAFRFARAWRGMLRWWKATFVLGLMMGLASLPVLLVNASLGLFGGDDAALEQALLERPEFFITYFLAVTVLYSLLFLALWFASALVVLGGVSPGRALWLSAKAALRNILPLSVFGLVVIALGFALMMLLGIAFAVVIGVTGLAGATVDGSGALVIVGGVVGALVYAFMLIGMLAVSCQAQYASYLDVFAYGPATQSAPDEDGQPTQSPLTEPSTT